MTPFGLRDVTVGELQAWIDPQTGMVRRVSFRGAPILQGLYGAVRDQNWDTILPEISDFSIKETVVGKRATFTAHCEAGPVRYRWTGAVEVTSNQLTYHFLGEALSDFQRNRIGLCVQHAMEMAGCPFGAEHADGGHTNGHFPGMEISPHQPVMGLSGMVIRVDGDLQAQLQFEGDVFEMEDQRNWSDRSFKTYCTPLDLPFPVQVHAGDVVDQRVSLRLSGSPAGQTLVTEPSERVAGCRFRFGTAWEPDDDQPLSAYEVELLRALRLTHLRVNWEPDRPEAFRAGLKAAADLGVPLEIGVAYEPALDPLLEALLRENNAPLNGCRWLLSDRHEKSLTDAGLVNTFRRLLLNQRLDSCDIFAGTTAYFTELNRFRPPTDVIDGVCYSVNPQVHAFDEISLRESADVFVPIARAADWLSSGLPQAIGPITLRPRFNPNATETPQRDGTIDADSVDPRQVGAFNASWTLLSLFKLFASTASEDRIVHTTVHFARGPRGLFNGNSPLTVSDFPATRGTVFPVCLALRLMQEFEPETIVTLHVQRPYVDALSAFKENQARLFLLNFSDDTVELELPISEKVQRFWSIDEAMTPLEFEDVPSWLNGVPISISPETFTLNPFEVRVLDLQGEFL